jgi:hypothetical protein
MLLVARWRHDMYETIMLSTQQWSATDMHITSTDIDYAQLGTHMHRKLRSCTSKALVWKYVLTDI